MEEIKFEGFYEALCKTVEGDPEALYGDIVKYAPIFFKLLCEILEDERTDWHTRLAINAALAYFVVPNDIIPEDKHGSLGYVDDVFLCVYVLREIKREIGKEIIVDNWNGKEDIIEIINDIYFKSKKIVKNECVDILEFSGLIKKQTSIGIPRMLDSKIHFEDEKIVSKLGAMKKIK